MGIAVVLTALLTLSDDQPQCHPAGGGGDLDCPCISSYAGLNLSSAVRFEGMNHTGAGYGLHSCRAHDARTAPYCNVTSSANPNPNPNSADLDLPEP